MKQKISIILKEAASDRMYTSLRTSGGHRLEERHIPRYCERRNAHEWIMSIGKYGGSTS